MAKKFGKFVLTVTALGAAAVGAYYYLQGKEKPAKPVAYDDEDFDDFSEDLDEEPEERTYVTLTPEKVTETVKKAAEEAKDFAQFAAGEAKEFAQDVIQSTKEAIAARKESTKAAAEEVVEEAGEAASEAAEEAGEVLEETVEEVKEAVSVNTPKVETFLDEEEEDNE